MFEKNPNLRYWNVNPKRIVRDCFVRTPNAVVNGEGNTDFLCAFGEASLLIDFGEEVVGEAKLKITCLQHSNVTIVYEEMPEYAMRREPFSCSWYEGLIDKYELEAGEHILHSKGRRGFRYIAIFVTGTATVRLNSVEAINGGWPLEQKGFFRCSDERLNRIWDICVATIRACMQDFYEDGVKRDGLLWIGDCRWTFLSGYYALGDSSLARKCLLMIRDSQYENGAIPACAIPGGGHQHDSESGISYMGDVLKMLDHWVIINYISEYIYAIDDYIRITGDLGILT